MAIRQLSCVLTLVTASVAATATAQDNACDVVCDLGGYDCCDPLWTAHVNYVYMCRENPGNIPLIGPAIGPPIFNASQFDFGGESGIDISIRYENECDIGFELRYLWINDFTSAPGVFNGSGNESVLTNPPSGPLGGPWTPSYRSAIQSAEILGRRCAGRFHVTYGFRYVDLDEASLNIMEPPGNVYEFVAKNDLYGFQLALTASFGTTIAVCGSMVLPRPVCITTIWMPRQRW
jgi:hypothetical protein